MTSSPGYGTRASFALANRTGESCPGALPRSRGVQLEPGSTNSGSAAIDASCRRGLLCAGRPRGGPSSSALGASMGSPVAPRQVVAQDDSAVVKDIVRAVEQSHRASPFGVEDELPGAGVRVELFLISPAKFFPTLHLMTEPLPQLRAGGDLLHPRICRECFLLHASRPEPLHHDSPAISARRWLVRAFDPNHGVGFLSALPPPPWPSSCSST